MTFSYYSSWLLEMVHMTVIGCPSELQQHCIKIIIKNQDVKSTENDNTLLRFPLKSRSFSFMLDASKFSKNIFLPNFFYLMSTWILCIDL